MSASSPAFVLFCFLDDSPSDWVRWDVNAVLIYISFMAKDVENSLGYLLDTLPLLRKNYLFNFLFIN
jgi:hypothetical protein